MPCVVCTVGAAKYKCPKCRLPYCSVACYKEHQKVDCTVAATVAVASEAAVPQESLATAQATPSEPGAPAEETREDGELQETAAGRPGVSAELLSKLDASDALKLSLEDPSLQSVVRGILTSKQPLDELAVALHDHPELASLAALVHGIVDSDALLKQQRHHS